MEDLVEIQESTEFESMTKYTYNLTRNTQQYQNQLIENLKIWLCGFCPVFMV